MENHNRQTTRNALPKNAARDDQTPVHHATADDFRKAFTEHREELEWLAFFLTGNQDLVQSCMVDAYALAVTQKQVFLDWLEHWSRRATILSAIKMQQSRIAQLGAAYRRHPCPHREHARLTPEEIELLKTHPNDIVGRIDVLCRFALVMRGIEEYPPKQSALMLDVNGVAFEAAYCAALESLQMLKYEILDVVGDET
jgi:DNA-directed RNA polymerase specialized sigma24 family protein